MFGEKYIRTIYMRKDHVIRPFGGLRPIGPCLRTSMVLRHWGNGPFTQFKSQIPVTSDLEAGSWGEPLDWPKTWFIVQGDSLCRC